MATVIPVVLLTLWLEPKVKTLSNPYVRSLTDQFLGAAVPEELSRFLIVLAYCAWRKAFTRAIDGVIVGVAVALGLATVEAVLDFFSLWIQQNRDLSKVIGRLIAVVSHACTGAIMGRYVASAMLLPHRRGRYLVAALAVPVVFHTLLDFAVFTDVPDDSTIEDLDSLPSWPTALLTLLWMTILLVELVWAICIFKRIFKAERACVGEATAD
ncbi:hypothetical protein AYO40_04710 [Planctomycetaceae bacterium SCGC AG-212-D15]|nr:hypothetical protein AYO40_04710 [Planctomycetaceae bacterium SCGC AG-212-D15]